MFKFTSHSIINYKFCVWNIPVTSIFHQHLAAANFPPNMPSWMLWKAAPLETHGFKVMVYCCAGEFIWHMDPLCWIHSRSHTSAISTWPLTGCNQGRGPWQILSLCLWGSFSLACLLRCQTENTFCQCDKLSPFTFKIQENIIWESVKWNLLWMAVDHNAKHVIGQIIDE